ncbi:MAG: 6-phospho-3-hexuloisomerase [Ruminiclostridium sp.]
MSEFSDKFKHNKNIVLNELDLTLKRIDPDNVEELVERILNARMVFFVGVGRVMLSLQAITKRLAHLGINAHYVGEITEPAITSEDLLIIGSGSGESLFPLNIARKAKQLGATVVHIGSNSNSSMKQYTDLMVRVPVRTKLALEDEINSEQPMTSLFEQALLLIGDIIAKIIIDKKGLEMNELWQYHANLE